MKKLLMATLLLSGSLFAYDYPPQVLLQAGNKFYEEVNGDGYERGFAFQVKVMAVQKKGEKLKITKPYIRISNDSADCFDNHSIDFIKKELRYEFGEKKYYTVTFGGEVNTAVNADTGGCIATVYASEEVDSDLLKIIDYTYITDY